MTVGSFHGTGTHANDLNESGVTHAQLAHLGRTPGQPLFVVAHLVSFTVRMIVGGMLPGWPALLAPVFEAMLWPLVTVLLLAPQRRAPDRDQNRPL